MRRIILAILPLLCACEGEAEKAVRSEMLDPDAAQFRDVQRCSGDRDVWRGEVNGKNRMGAFVGFKPFFYSDYSVAFLEGYNFSSMMERCYSDLEKPKGEASGSPDPGVAKIAEAIQKPTSQSSKAASGEPMHGDYGDEDVTESLPDQCWADYCPCDKADPDYGDEDVSICRNLRMGVSVSASKFASGAQSRDARKALREFNESAAGYRRPKLDASPSAAPGPQLDHQAAPSPKRFPYVAPDGVDTTGEKE